jgi:2-polyprenyl-3-methyl-5-hydroxy-6-metoxy-1,4-benzoquinol methylase
MRSPFASRLEKEKLKLEDFRECCPLCQSEDTKFVLRKDFSLGNKNEIILYSCLDCDGTFLAGSKDQFQEQMYEYYESYSGKTKEEIYDSQTRSSYVEVLRMFERHTSGRSILDVGCGKGDFVDAALANNWIASGIDLSQSAIKIGRAFNLPLSGVDFFSESIKSSTLDVVTLFEVIEHVRNPAAYLRRAEELVVNGGLVYITTPNFNSLERRLLGKFYPVIHPEHLIYFSRKTLTNIINNQTTLELIHTETRNVSLTNLTQLFSLFRPSRTKTDCFKVSGAERIIDQKIRETIAKSKTFRVLKTLANRGLDMSGLGNTLVFLLRRP